MDKSRHYNSNSSRFKLPSIMPPCSDEVSSANLLRIEPRNIRSQAASPIQTSKSHPPAYKSKSIQRNQAPLLPVPHQAVHHVVQQPLPRCCSRPSPHHRLPCLTHHPSTLTRAFQQNHTYLLHHDRPQCRSLGRSCVQSFRPPRRKLRGVLCSVCLLLSQLLTTRSNEQSQPLSQEFVANARAIQVRERVQCCAGRVRAPAQPEQCVCLRSCSQPDGDYGGVEGGEEG